METKITIKNRLNIWLITGDEVPELGSTCIAYPKPHEVAIFSPANAAAENQIVRINPPVSPIAISFKIIAKKLFIKKINYSNKGFVLEFKTDKITNIDNNSHEQILINSKYYIIGKNMQLENK